MAFDLSGGSDAHCVQSRPSRFTPPHCSYRLGTQTQTLYLTITKQRGKMKRYALKLVDPASAEDAQAQSLKS